MNYSFFGTCFEDDHLLIDCLKSISKQTVPANEIILIDSSERGNILKYLNELFKESITIIKYENINLPRVKALNLAISKSNSNYLLRFDSRTRFAENYAEEAIKLLIQKNKNKLVVGSVGGRQNSTPSDKSINSKIASGLMDRAYVFGNPMYRRINFSGSVNSIYLGCYPKEIIKFTKYREEVNLISEDSQLCQDIISRGYQILISNNLNLKYLCRENVFSLFKLLRSYGRCRAATIISTKTIHDKKRYIKILLMVIFFPFCILIILKEKILTGILITLSIPLMYNIFHEIRNYGFRKIFYMPLLALLAQLSWGLGFVEAATNYKIIKKKISNYLK